MEVFSVSNFASDPEPPVAEIDETAPGPLQLAQEAGMVEETGARVVGARVKNPVTGLETVIGDDERLPVVASDRDPWRRICQLDLIGPSSTFKGTGWFAGPATVLTAGHCVHYAPFFGGWANEIVVGPGRHRETFPFGTVRSKRFSTLNVWVDGQAADWDIGCIHLDAPLGTTAGKFALANLGDADLEGKLVTVSGYPTDKDQAKVQYCHANRVLKATERRIFYEIDTVSGQSGAPVFLEDVTDGGDPVCVAIHAYGVPGTPIDLHITANSAPRIDAKVAALIAAWVKADNARLGLT